MTSFLEKFSLKGKTAFVSGGAGLLGSEVSCALSGAGARVIILDIDAGKAEDVKKRINEAGFNADYVYFDIADTENIEKTINALFEKYEGADIWVNAAYPRTKDWAAPLEDVNVNSWRKNIDMHLNGYYFSAQKIAECMKKQKSGSIINFASIYGIVGPDFSLYEDTNMTMPPAYSAIKGAVVNFTKHLASYYGKHNIRVNSVSPGGVRDAQPEKFISRYSEKTPLGRMANKEDITGAVIFLASDASGYVTGHNLVVDGGWSIV